MVYHVVRKRTARPSERVVASELNKSTRLSRSGLVVIDRYVFESRRMRSIIERDKIVGRSARKYVIANIDIFQVCFACGADAGIQEQHAVSRTVRRVAGNGTVFERELRIIHDRNACNCVRKALVSFVGYAVYFACADVAVRHGDFG